MIDGNAAQVRLTRRGYNVDGRGPSSLHLGRGEILPLLVVKDFQSVDLPFAFERDVLDFPTECSRYHLSAWTSDGSLIRLIVVPVNATIQQNSCFNLVALRAEGQKGPIGNTELASARLLVALVKQRHCRLPPSFLALDHLTEREREDERHQKKRELKKQKSEKERQAESKREREKDRKNQREK